ncbi:MAG: 50S ribosomal protein L10 [Candidatus Absconditabacteria bacterium]|nr:50S ribosomal protein L10 [Candidatus Absconditabacteria bacterium]
MAITKDKKKELLKQYVEDLKNAGSTYIVNQSGISVDVSTKIRKEMKLTDAKFNVLRKRLFLRAVEEAGLEKVDLESLQGATVAIFAKNEDFTPLKIISKYSKGFEKAGEKSSFGFLGGWTEKKWQDGTYVSELANIPSKEELLSKFIYLLKYPVQSFACVLDQVAKKQG